MKLGVIIPYVQEWPQIAFTVRAIHEELKGIEHEIVVVDNFCEQVWDQFLDDDKLLKRGMGVDHGHDRIELNSREMVAPWLDIPESDVRQHHANGIEAQAKNKDWLTYVGYSDKLSHWGAKRAGCQATDAPLLMFVDSHVSPSRDCLRNMYHYYVANWDKINGSLHAPLTYHILEDHRLIYKLVYERGLLGYSFTGYRDLPEPYEVPVMSTCGMMIGRDVMDSIGGWPEELGIYGGGENFINGALAVTGRNKWIMNGPPLHHHGSKRGYHYEWLDHKRNQAIAMYLIAGGKALPEYLRNLKPYRRYVKLFNKMTVNIIESCCEQRELIKSNSVISIEEWVKTWKD